MKRYCLSVFLLTACCSPEDTTANLACGPGTEQHDGTCRPYLTCAPGVDLKNNTCLSDSKACGPGTQVVGDACVPTAGPTYQVLVGSAKLSANGYTPVSLLALGTNSDGTPATGTILWGLSRPGAGTLAPLTRALTPLGASGSFIPCSAAVDIGCAGPLQVTLALAGQPQLLVASSALLELALPADVYSPTACQGNDNVVVLDGAASDYIHPGVDTITAGTFVLYGDVGTAPNNLRISVNPTDPKQGQWWNLEFSTRNLNLPLRAQVYDGAERAAFAAPGNPGLSVTGNGRGCNNSQGRFQIQELVTESAKLTRMTATFEQTCDGRGLLRGCVHLENK